MAEKTTAQPIDPAITRHADWRGETLARIRIRAVVAENGKAGARTKTKGHEGPRRSIESA